MAKKKTESAGRKVGRKAKGASAESESAAAKRSDSKPSTPKPSAGRRCKPQQQAFETSRARDRKKQALIASLRESGGIYASCDAVGISTSAHYAWMEADGDYAKAIQEALVRFQESLELECDRRARHGLRRYKFHKGEPVLIACDKAEAGAFQVGTDKQGQPVYARHYFEVEYSDNLLMFRLKKLDPSYRDGVTINNQNGASIVLEDRQGEGIYEILRRRLTGGAN